MVNTTEVINLLLDKFRVENDPNEFALYVVRDNGGKYYFTFELLALNELPMKFVLNRNSSNQRRRLPIICTGVIGTA